MVSLLGWRGGRSGLKAEGPADRCKGAKARRLALHDRQDNEGQQCRDGHDENNNRR
jgi:hypothetical protein